MEYTKEQIEEFKLKAQEWDKLGKEIERHYINLETNEPWTDEEAEEKGYNLESIGEVCAAAYGWAL